MLKLFLAWWGRQLRAMAPEPLRRLVTTRPHETVLKLHELPGERPGPFAIAMPRHLVLEKRLTLPAAAEQELARVISYEMDRETPFTAQEVYWQAEIEARDAQRRQISLRLFLVPRDTLAKPLERLAAVNVRPMALLVEGARRIPLDRDTVRDLRLSWRQALLPAACLALVLLAAGLPFLRQSLALSATEDRIATLTPEVAAVAKFRRALGQDDSAAVIAAQRQTMGDPLAMLAAMTRALPDDTNLTALRYAKRHVTLAGASAEAPALIRHLATDPAFRGPSFAAPIIRAADSSRDSFSIAVTFAETP
ncbi:MAG TPA: PilN domain-containing protein [Stellaceae bacterium]|nr:PilN domain-containing protein [Stellaceae bacterium]